MDNVLKAFLIQVLRRASYKWRPRTIAKNKARVKIGEFSTGKEKYGYRCNNCKNIFMAKEIALDHINPVVPPNGYKSGLDFDVTEFSERMFCNEAGFSVLCSFCHDIKTREELALRVEHRHASRADNSKFKRTKKDKKTSEISDKSENS